MEVNSKLYNHENFFYGHFQKSYMFIIIQKESKYLTSI